MNPRGREKPGLDAVRGMDIKDFSGQDRDLLDAVLATTVAENLDNYFHWRGDPEFVESTIELDRILDQTAYGQNRGSTVQVYSMEQELHNATSRGN